MVEWSIEAPFDSPFSALARRSVAARSGSSTSARPTGACALSWLAPFMPVMPVRVMLLKNPPMDVPVSLADAKVNGVLDASGVFGSHRCVTIRGDAPVVTTTARSGATARCAAGTPPHAARGTCSGYLHARAGFARSQKDPPNVSSSAMRRGWGLRVSWLGVWPKFAICACVAFSNVGSSIASMSTFPSYVR